MLNLTKDKRKSLGSFYTPDSLADEMVSKFESLDGNFVDFTAGDGSLLRALNRAGVFANGETSFQRVLFMANNERNSAILN